MDRVPPVGRGRIGNQANANEQHPDAEPVKPIGLSFRLFSLVRDGAVPFECQGRLAPKDRRHRKSEFVQTHRSKAL